MQRDQIDALELRHVLVLAEEKETQLKTETERLQTKVSRLRDVVATLERSLQRFLPT